MTALLSFTFSLAQKTAETWLTCCKVSYSFGTLLSGYTAIWMNLSFRRSWPSYFWSCGRRCCSSCSQRFSWFCWLECHTSLCLLWSFTGVSYQLIAAWLSLWLVLLVLLRLLGCFWLLTGCRWNVSWIPCFAELWSCLRCTRLCRWFACFCTSEGSLPWSVFSWWAIGQGFRTFH